MFSSFDAFEKTVTNFGRCSFNELEDGIGETMKAILNLTKSFLFLGSFIPMLCGAVEPLTKTINFEDLLKSVEKPTDADDIITRPEVIIHLTLNEYSAVRRLIEETNAGDDIEFYRSSLINLSSAIHMGFIKSLPEYFPSRADDLMTSAAKTASDFKRTVKDTRFPGVTKYRIVIDFDGLKGYELNNSSLNKLNRMLYKDYVKQKIKMKQFSNELSAGERNPESFKSKYRLARQMNVHSSLSIDDLLNAIDRASNRISKVSEQNFLDDDNKILGYASGVVDAVRESDLRTIPEDLSEKKDLPLQLRIEDLNLENLRRLTEPQLRMENLNLEEVLRQELMKGELIHYHYSY